MTSKNKSSVPVRVSKSPSVNKKTDSVIGKKVADIKNKKEYKQNVLANVFHIKEENDKNKTKRKHLLIGVLAIVIAVIFALFLAWQEYSYFFGIKDKAVNYAPASSLLYLWADLNDNKSFLQTVSNLAENEKASNTIGTASALLDKTLSEFELVDDEILNSLDNEMALGLMKAKNGTDELIHPYIIMKLSNTKTGKDFISAKSKQTGIRSDAHLNVSIITKLGDNSLSYALDKNYLLFSTDRTIIEEMLDSKYERATSLKYNSNYKKLRRSLSAQPFIFSYLQPQDLFAEEHYLNLTKDLNINNLSLLSDTFIKPLSELAFTITPTNNNLAITFSTLTNEKLSAINEDLFTLIPSDSLFIFSGNNLLQNSEVLNIVSDNEALSELVSSFSASNEITGSFTKLFTSDTAVIGLPNAKNSFDIATISNKSDNFSDSDITVMTNYFAEYYGTLHPTEISTTLSDGSSVIELMPDENKKYTTANENGFTIYKISEPGVSAITIARSETTIIIGTTESIVNTIINHEPNNEIANSFSFFDKPVSFNYINSDVFQYTDLTDYNSLFDSITAIFKKPRNFLRSDITINF
ncbi:MAG: DUF3352 domain-containing protein [bacterium]